MIQDTFILVPINHYLKLSQNNDKELKFIEQILSKQPKSTKEHSIFKMISSRLEKLRKIKQIDLNELFLNQNKWRDFENKKAAK